MGDFTLRLIRNIKNQLSGGNAFCLKCCETNRDIILIIIGKLLIYIIVLWKTFLSFIIFFCLNTL